MSFQTIKVRFQEPICFVQFNRPDSNNTINDLLIQECRQALASCDDSVTVVVLEGLPEVFCFGADFQGMARGEPNREGPEGLYDLWMQLANGPFVTIAHVRGKANAGGLGFVAACDIVLADSTAQFSLSELLFGFFPACVMPFLIRRIGFQKAHYLTLMTQPISAQKACDWGLADAVEQESAALLRKHLLRLRRLAKPAVLRYKRYMNSLYRETGTARDLAVAANYEVFSDPDNLAGVARFVENGVFPWEG